MREREETRDRKERQGDVDDTDDLLRSLMDLSEQKDLLERERETGKKGGGKSATYDRRSMRGTFRPSFTAIQKFPNFQ